MIFLFISGAEIVFIFFIILMIFGADKIPDIAKGMAKGIKKVKDATQVIKTEIKKNPVIRNCQSFFDIELLKGIF